MLDSGTIVSVPQHRITAIHRVVDQAIARVVGDDTELDDVVIYLYRWAM